MNIKKLLLFTLIIRTFSAEFILPAQNQNDSGSTVAIVSNVLQAGSAVLSMLKDGQTVSHNLEKQKTEKPDSTLKVNNGHLKVIADTQVALANASARKGADPEIKKEQTKNDKALINFNRFIMEDKLDKEIFSTKNTYKSEDPETDNSTTKEPETKITPTPGKLKQAAAFMAATPIIAADAIANIFPINASLAHLAQSESFRNGFLDIHQKNIGRAAAFGLMAGAAVVLYKTYAWYTNEDRLLACETVVELEEQQKEIATQFKKEMQKSTLSAEEKAKLQRAYDNYMEELAEEIAEQKIAAGYGMTKKLAIGVIAITTGLAGLTTLAKYYLPQSLATLIEQTNMQQNLPITNTNLADQNTEALTQQTSETTTTPDSQTEQTYDPTEYNNLTTFQRNMRWPTNMFYYVFNHLLSNCPPSEWNRIDRIQKEHDDWDRKESKRTA